MKIKRKHEIKNAVLSHIAKTIRGELSDWSNLKMWLDFNFKTTKDEDEAEKIFYQEIKRIEKRVSD